MTKGQDVKKTIKICPLCKEKFHPKNIRQVICSWECKLNHEKTRLGQRLSSGHLGALSEMIVCADLIEKGFYVFRSISPNGPVDVIGMKDKKLFKIEVKTGYRSLTNGKITKPGHAHAEHDILAVYLPEERSVVYFPELEMM